MLDSRPVFVPSTRTVEQAAERLWKAVTKPNLEQEWVLEPAHVRAFWNQRALDMLSGAGQDLVVDAIEHLADHHDDYEFDGDPDDLRETVIRLRKSRSGLI